MRIVVEIRILKIRIPRIRILKIQMPEEEEAVNQARIQRIPEGELAHVEVIMPTTHRIMLIKIKPIKIKPPLALLVKNLKIQSFQSVYFSLIWRPRGWGVIGIFY